MTTDKVTQAQAWDAFNGLVSCARQGYVCTPSCMTLSAFIEQHPDEPAKTIEQERLDRIKDCLDAIVASAAESFPTFEVVIGADGRMTIEQRPQS